MKQRIIPIVSILIGILAFWLTAKYLRSQQAELEEERRRIYEGARQISIVAAAHDVPAGTVLEESDIGSKKIYEQAAPARVITVDEAALVLGKKTLLELRQDKPVLWSDIEGGGPGEVGLASIIKPGMRAISLSVSGAASVSGMVEPNDRVDVLGTFAFPSTTEEGEMEAVTLTVLQDVTVLACGQLLAKSLVSEREPRRAGYQTVTLEVTPREAELLVFAEQIHGRLTLSLRNQKDVSFETDLPSVNFNRLQAVLPDLNVYRQQNIRHKRTP